MLLVFTWCLYRVALDILNRHYNYVQFPFGADGKGLLVGNFSTVFPQMSPPFLGLCFEGTYFSV